MQLLRDLAKKKGMSAKRYVWSTEGDLQTRGMLLSNNEQRLIVAGSKGDWVMSEDAFNGKEGTVLRILNASDGSVVNQYDLPAQPVFDGLSAARGRLFIALKDGFILSLGK